ncbi:MAG: TrkA family potassium uptake protein [Alicyclobacillus herbarius]|uniref:potassium channel family protein n=1 Tax=Alicyclobacillus herbarius TaxID=122960 RepID=UPI00040AAE2E|nr:TrkA family potassium uptake protein [Alicyclobacillus herbarius]MCL6632832.1 TrkA family potassium uptake protein [Alicyclobacillus herbarius]
MAKNRGLTGIGPGRFLNGTSRRQPKTIGIIGAGRFGTGAAQELLRHGHNVLIVDRDPSCLEQLAPLCHTAIGNAEDSDFLAEAGFKDVDAVIVAIGDNETSSNHATINCKDFGLYVVAKATHPTHGKILERLGADMVVYPEHDSGVRIARMLTRSAVLEMFELYEEVFMMEVTAGGELLHKSLEELNLPRRFGVQVVLIIRGRETLFPVSAQDVIEPDDKLLLLGSSESLHTVAKLAENSK